jgi:mevalonate kinase
MKAGDVETARCLDELGGLSTAACDALQGPGGQAARRIGELAEQAMRRLRALGLCVPAQDGLLDAGRAAGALGGKLSGAGGGGAFFMVAPDRRAAVRIARSIEAEAGKRGTALAGALRAIGT